MNYTSTFNFNQRIISLRLITSKGVLRFWVLWNPLTLIHDFNPVNSTCQYHSCQLNLLKISPVNSTLRQISNRYVPTDIKKGISSIRHQPAQYQKSLVLAVLRHFTCPPVTSKLRTQRVIVRLFQRASPKYKISCIHWNF